MSCCALHIWPSRKQLHCPWSCCIIDHRACLEGLEVSPVTFKPNMWLWQNLSSNFLSFLSSNRAATRLWHAHCYGKFAASSRLNLKGYFVRAADLAARLIIWDTSGAVILSTKLLWSNTSQVGGTDTSLLWLISLRSGGTLKQLGF